MNSILHYDKIDVNEISLSNLNITSDENIYNSFIRLKDKKLIVQVNNLIINNIINEGIDGYFLICNIIQNDFYKFILELDKHIINLVKKNGKIWFNSDTSDKISDIYKSCIQIPDNLNDKPRIKIRIPIKNNSFISKFFDSSGNRIGINHLEVNKKFSMIININLLKLTSRTFYLDIYLYQLKLNKTVEYALVSDTDSDDIILSDDK
jgi:hypothetical protein